MKLTDVEIYAHARSAGFTPNQAVTMTAIALAESGGDPTSLNDRGEHSIGLWQINLAVHTGTEFNEAEGFDPAANARLAYQVSTQGEDIGRWTVTHRDKGARYLQVADRAEAAAAEYGEPRAKGSGNPPLDYRAPVIAADPEQVSATALTHSLQSANQAQTAAVGSGVGLSDQVAPAMQPQPADDGLRTFLNAALAQDGDEYIYGATADGKDADPEAFDCAELVQWAAARAGVEVPTGSWLQYLELKQRGTVMSVEEALHTPGALVFSFSEEPVAGGGRPSKSHVAISLGDGENLIEARSSKYGVGQFSAESRGFTHAAHIPELGTELATPLVTASLDDGANQMALPPNATESSATPGAAPGQAFEHNQDSDSDGLVDSLEQFLGTDPFHPDTDRDGFPDVQEVTDFDTDPLDFGDTIISQASGRPTPGVSPPTTTEVRAAEEAAERRAEELAEEAAAAEAAAAQAAADAAKAEAEEAQAKALAEAEQLRLEAIERDQTQHQEVVAALLGKTEQEAALAEAVAELQLSSFSFTEEQAALLAEQGIVGIELDSLELATRDGQLEDWFGSNLGLFNSDSRFNDAEAYGEFQQWLEDLM